MQLIFHFFKPSFWFRIKYFGLRIPFRGYFIAFLGVLWLGWLWLNRQPTISPSLFNDALALLLKWIPLFFFPLLLVGGLSVLVPWGMLHLCLLRKGLSMTIASSSYKDKDVKNRHINIEIQPLWQPILGQLYYRLLYDEGRKMSPKFSLVRKENFLGYAGKRQNGWYEWPVSGISAYDIDKMLVYFEDLFHFFSFTVAIPVQQSFFTSPPIKPLESIDIPPALTENDVLKIEEWRKMSGEWLHYKHFEANDDVRRIIWKVYARNKELVVRMPEIMDPYASHLTAYASFYNTLGSLPNEVSGRCLDFYKTALWNLLNNLQQQQLDVKVQTDHPQPVFVSEVLMEQIAHSLAYCQFQPSKKLIDFVPINNTSLVCISSLTSAPDLAQLLSDSTNNIRVAFIPLSKAIPLPTGLHWLLWVLIEQEKDPVQRVRVRWLFSRFRKRMELNEKRLLAVLEKSGVPLVGSEVQKTITHYKR